MPTRRILGLMIVVALAAQPAWSLVKLWAAQRLGATSPDDTSHQVAKVAAVVS